MAETIALEAKMKFDTAEVTQSGTLKKGYKITGISGSGTVKLNKVTSYWLKRAAQAIKEGKAIRGTIISNLDDRKPLAANVYGLRIVFLQKSQLQTGKPESWAKSPFRLIFRILMYWMLFDRR